MMNMELIAKAEEQKRKIETALEDIRNTAVFLNQIDDNREDIRLAIFAGGKQIYLDRLLTQELAEADCQMILRDIDNCQRMKEDALEALLGTEDKKRETKEKKEDSGKKGNKSKSVLNDEEEEKLIRKLYCEEKLPVSRIAEQMGLTPTNVYDRMKKYNIPAKGHRQTKEKTDVPEGKEPADELKMKRILTERLQSGTTVHELAAEFKISKQEMFQKLQELGIKTKAFRPM